MLFMEYKGNLRISNYKFEKARFCVRIYGLPLKLMNDDIAGVLGRRIGDLVGIDQSMSRVGVGKFLRVRVEIDINKPLRRFVTVKLENRSDDL